MTPHPDDSDEIDPHRTRHQFITEFGEATGPARPHHTASPPTDEDSWLPPPKPPSSTARSGEVTGTRFNGPHHGPASIEVGQTLYGKYLVLRKLGGGAMGDVWLVRHLSLNRDHALKVIVPHLATHQGALKRFQREFQVMASFHHEHAIEIYDARLDEEGGYIDMQYVEGQTIHDVLSAARSRAGRDRSAPLMPFPWILRVLGQLCEVLELAHQHEIVHRDLKPSNLMLLARRPPGREYLKVLDFGIAKIRHDPENKLNDATLTGGFIGTPSYSSPEQVYSRPVDGRADLYSIGVMLYEIVCGRLPFVGQQTLVMLQHAQKPPPPFAEANPDLKVAPEIEQAILRMLAKEPEGRPATAQALFEEFHAAVSAHLPPSIAGPNTESVPDMTPPTWGATPYYSPPVESTERETPLLPGTEEDTSASSWSTSIADSRPSATSVATQKLPPVPELAPKAPPLPPTGWPEWSPPPRWPKFVAAAVLLVALVGAAFAAWRLLRSPAEIPIVTNPDDPGKGKADSSLSPPISTSKADRLPVGYVAVKGDQPDRNGWPAVVRRVEDVSLYRYYADGVYLPIEFEPEGDPGSPDLVDGWPRVIVRKKDPTHARYIRIEGEKEFDLGAWDNPNAIKDREDAPAHAVILTGFYMQEAEVTNGQVEDFYENNFSKAKPVEWDAGYDELKQALGKEMARTHPAVNLSRKDADAYAQSFGAKLPTEAQWEYAARSRGERLWYTWGGEPPGNAMANIDFQGAGVPTAPPCSFPRDRTRQGLCDMGGNVQEWCRDVYSPYQRPSRTVRDPYNMDGVEKVAKYVVRGAAWSSPPGYAVTTRRDDRFPEVEKREDLGFRVVVECPYVAPRQR